MSEFGSERRPSEVPPVSGKSLGKPQHERGITALRNVDTIYHYTSVIDWEGIQRDGELKARTNPRGLDITLEPSLRDIPKENPDHIFYWKDRHVVGGADFEEFTPWKEAGLHDRLLRYTSKGLDVVLLSFPVDVVEEAFVKEHYYESPAQREAVFGYPLDEQTPIEDPEVRTMLNELTGKYHRSVVRGTLYDGSYRVPEVWIPHGISLEDITVERVGNMEDFR